MSQNLLITGGAGFIGSNFIHYWFNKYPMDNIIIIDSLSYASNLNSIKLLIEKNNIKFFKGNIKDPNLVFKILNDFEITYLINFAAESHVDRSINASDIFVESNILGTHNLLDCFRKYWIQNKRPEDWRFLQISTDEVFGSLNPNDDSFTELSLYKPRSPYSATKASSDHLVNSWNHTYGIPTLITNCSNNYGPFQFPEKLIPLTITNLLRSKKIPLYGDGLNIRDWLFVDDHCSAIDSVINKAEPGQQYCIGGNNEIRNLDLINQICDLVDEYAPKYNFVLKHKKSTSLIEYVTDRPGHDRRYAINSSKINKDLNWQAKYKFNEGLDETVQWYLNNEK